MVMTTGIFHGFFAILVVALVVIFQEELRAVFERIAVWSLAGGASVAPTGSEVQNAILVRTLADLARERIGALVVVQAVATRASGRSTVREWYWRWLATSSISAQDMDLGL